MNKQNLKNWLKSFGILVAYISVCVALYYLLELLHSILNAKSAGILGIIVVLIFVTGLIKESMYDGKL